MIAAVTTAQHKAAFAAAVADRPYFRAVMATDLALWADNPGAPIKLYMASGAALGISGHRARLCAAPGFDWQNYDWDELNSFLQFCGARQLLCSDPCTDYESIGWNKEKDFSLFTLPAGERLPQPAMPSLLADGTLRLAERPSMQQTARLLFAQDEVQQDYFYSVASTAINHGYGKSLALMCGDSLITTVGCYECENGEAYMSAGKTVPQLRGQGLGGWLIVLLANRLAAERWQVTLLCEQKLDEFYAKLKFQQNGQYTQYNTI